jgi:hypothetical protein
MTRDENLDSFASIVGKGHLINETLRAYQGENT